MYSRPIAGHGRRLKDGFPGHLLSCTPRHPTIALVRPGPKTVLRVPPREELT